MKLRSLHPKTFTQLTEVLKDTITDVLIHFHPDSIKIRAADTAKTCITYVNIPGAALDHYECERYQPVGVNIPKLWTVLKVSTSDDVCAAKGAFGKLGCGLFVEAYSPLT